MSDEADEKKQKPGEEFKDNIVTIWSKAVDTQMHFNEMSVKSRQLGLTFVAAALGLAVFLFSRSGSEARFAFSGSVRLRNFGAVACGRNPNGRGYVPINQAKGFAAIALARGQPASWQRHAGVGAWHPAPDRPEGRASCGERSDD